MRKAGTVMREIQNTSQSFIREMERAADSHEAHAAHTPAPSYGNGAASEGAYLGDETSPYRDAYAYDETTAHAEEAAHWAEAPASGDAPSAGEAARLEAPGTAHAAYEPPAPDPEPPPAARPPVGEKLAEPRPALDFADAPTQPFNLADAPTVMRPAVSATSMPAQPAPEPDRFSNL